MTSEPSKNICKYCGDLFHHSSKHPQQECCRRPNCRRAQARIRQRRCAEKLHKDFSGSSMQVCVSIGNISGTRKNVPSRKKTEERERKKSKLKNGEADQRKATNYFGHFTRPLTVRQSSYSISGGFRYTAAYGKMQKKK